jgi:uncharacterized protein (DUF433 family)
MRRLAVFGASGKVAGTLKLLDDDAVDLIKRARYDEGRGCTMNWLECSEIEAVTGKMGGKPVIKGTRVQPETIVDNFDGGSSIEEIHDNYPHLTVDTIRRIIEFHHSHQLTP